VTSLEDRRLGAATILFGEGGGKYPDNNALLVEGAASTMLIDPSLGVRARGRSALPGVDLVLLSHCHEDHTAALPLFRDVPVHVHEEDLPGLLDFDGFLDIFGVEPARRGEYGRYLRETFFYEARPDAVPFRDGDLFDLGGGVSVRVIHTPGHTRGHCCLLIEPDGILFLADIDLSGFGPYYGDGWSDLEAFERSLEQVRGIQAAHYLSGHHIGLLDDRDAFLNRLGRYVDRIADREGRLLEYLKQPRTMDDIVAHRFVYRPHDQGDGIAKAERRSAELHLERLERDGLVERAEERYRTLRQSL
jgi:glyoxylase-like metal-dependent hydrolase (beta-lactamase superfamily II)